MARFLTPEQKAESYKRAKEAKLCRWCGLDVHRLSAKRRTFCSDECVHEFNIRSSASYIRIYIAKRDKYICQICGLDCKGFVSRLRRYVREHIQELQQQPIYAGYQNYRHAQRALEMEFFDLRNMEWVNTHGRSTFYDIDHIIPVSENKNQCGEENLRTLCLGCHRKETAKLRARLKKANLAASDSSLQVPESPS